MRFLVVGAGAIGGYFGGRLLEAGRDVTFLVRPRRAEMLVQRGLVIRSPAAGDVTLPSPPTVLAEALETPFDVILLSCKAYDLDGAIAAVAPAVGPNTLILPLLNGMGHLDVLDARFGAEKVLGGLCIISTDLDADGRVLHLNDMHSLMFGERNGTGSARAQALAQAFAGATFDGRLSETILQDMWEKWVFIATAAGINSLMRASVGDIVAAGAADLAMGLAEECAAIAARHGYPPRPEFRERSERTFTAAGSPMTASMLRDIERGAPVEAEHLLGDLLRRGGDAVGPRSLLRIAYAHLKAYEARRAREQGSGPRAS
ncbi:2-dehydropantoate 2-reductase [Chelatococcus sp. GCM10030263]|uniref:2-dehydropantoate 2-reductase n=1 Tax=Chelatococcus sp. GCM10030263 TaxID=3273387 RepID=UPI0036116F0D